MVILFYIGNMKNIKIVYLVIMCILMSAVYIIYSMKC